MILCCPGPSLEKEVQTILDSGRPIGLVNKAYWVMPRADFWFARDGSNNFDLNRIPTEARCILPLDRRISYRNLKRAEFMAFEKPKAPRLFCDGHLPVPRRSGGQVINNGLTWALHAASVLGFKRILLVGSEFALGKTTYAGGAPDPYPVKHHLDIHAKVFERVCGLVANIDPSFSIINCSGGRLTEVLPSMTLKEALTLHGD